MWRNLSRLLIVLVLSIPASATTIISFEDEGTTITMTPGAAVTLYINATSDCGLMALDAIVSISGGSATITGAMGDPGVITPPLYPFGWDFIPEPIYGPDYVEFGGSTLEANSSGIVSYVEITYESGTVVASLAPGQTWGGSLDGFGMPLVTFSDGVVTLVPEPATLLLLALGGAILRKRL